jgi:hypothetical protein
MELDSALTRQGEAFDPSPLPDYASGALARLVAAGKGTGGGEVSERERDHLRELAEEAMAGLVAAERELANASSRLVATAEMVAWVREIQAALEAN